MKEMFLVRVVASRFKLTAIYALHTSNNEYGATYFSPSRHTKLLRVHPSNQRCIHNDVNHAARLAWEQLFHVYANVLGAVYFYRERKSSAFHGFIFLPP